MMAPEFLLLFKGQEIMILDEKKSDVWALGVSLFQCMLLRTPFIGKYASSSDIMFKDFYNENYNEYWK
jgi:serine/threonine protein kinase